MFQMKLDTKYIHVLEESASIATRNLESWFRMILHDGRIKWRSNQILNSYLT
jgi:hypothetical protein